MHPDAVKAMEILRDPSFFNWSFAVMLAFVVYVYAVEIERRNWNIVLGALSFYGLEWFIEMLNGLVNHISGYSPVWTTTGRTMFQILPGLTIEISMMFAVAAVIFLKLLPKDPKMKILGMPNRPFLWVAFAVLMVAIECVVNAWGYLPWNYPWWNFPQVWLIILIGYMPYFMLSFYVHDLRSMKKKIAIVSGLAILDVILFCVFALYLKWM